MAEPSIARPPLDAPAGATAAEWSRKWFGGPTTIRRRTVSIGTTVTQLVPQNPRRVFWGANNRSINDGSIGFERDLTFATGDLVAALGGRAEMTVQEDGEAVGYEAFAVNNAAAGDWTVTEIIRV